MNQYSSNYNLLVRLGSFKTAECLSGRLSSVAAFQNGLVSESDLNSDLARFSSTNGLSKNDYALTSRFGLRYTIL